MRGTSKAAIAALSVGLAPLSALAGDYSVTSSSGETSSSLSLVTGSDAECTPVRAPIVTTFFVDGCDSLFGICTEGTIGSGPLAGTTRFTATSLDTESSQDTIGYTGVLVVTTSQGDVTILDSGALNLVDSTFFEIDEIAGGTDFFAGAGGTLFSSGLSTPTGFDGFISGQVCRQPEHDHPLD